MATLFAIFMALVPLPAVIAAAVLFEQRRARLRQEIGAVIAALVALTLLPPSPGRVEEEIKLLARRRQLLEELAALGG
jgi:hypothetical protein